MQGCAIEGLAAQVKRTREEGKGLTLGGLVRVLGSG